MLIQKWITEGFLSQDTEGNDSKLVVIKDSSKNVVLEIFNRQSDKIVFNENEFEILLQRLVLIKDSFTTDEEVD